MSDANRVNLAYDVESAYGVVPDVCDLQNIRFTSEDLKQDTESTISNELRSDRQRGDVIRTGLRANGGFNYEFSYEAFDELIHIAFMDDRALSADHSVNWNPAVVVGPAATISFTTPATIADSGSGFGSIVAGQWIRVEGSAANDGIYKVTTASAGTLIISHGAVATAGAGASITITQGEYVENGTTARSLCIEKAYLDLSNEFAVFLGAMIDTFSLDVGENSIITGNFGFLGKNETSGAATIDSAAGNTAAPTKSVMNAIDNVTAIYEGGTSMSIKSFSVNLKNNLRERFAIGVLGAESIGTGTVDVEGSITAVYTSKTIMDKYLDFTSSSLSLKFEDADGNLYVLEVPQIKYTNATRLGGGINTDVLAEMSFMSYRDPTELITIRMVRWDV